MKPAILLVDDHLQIIEFLKDVLSDDYKLFVAENGEKAIEILKSELIHVVISDVMMPVMDGFTLCLKIKTDRELSHIPVILLTAKTTLQSKVEGLEIGADIYIEKPFSPKYLTAQLASLLQNRLRLKEYFANTPLAQIMSIAHTKIDETFLQKLNLLIEENLDKPEFSVEDLAKYLHMSRPTLYRKISELTNLSPKELINVARLKKAAVLLLEGQHKISEIASVIGYNSQSYFTQAFLKQFGITPTHFAQMKNVENLNARLKQ